MNPKTIKMLLFVLVSLSFAWFRSHQTSAPSSSGPLTPALSKKSAVDTPQSWILALSWSPEFCYEKDREKKQAQCQVPRGFVVHGLWSELESTHCLNENYLPASAVELGKEVFPSLGLMKHEWKKHGACSGLDANQYFSKARELFVKTKLNKLFYEHPSSFSLVDFISLMRKELPTIKKENLAFMCNKRYLKELRICLDHRFEFETCPSRVESSCRGDEFFLRD